MKFSFQEEAKKAESGSYFKPKEGNNPIRIVSEFKLYESTYKGSRTRKFVGFVIDRKDGVVKPAFLAKTIIDLIGGLQNSPEYGFEEVPMPFDVTINAIGAGTMEVQYSVIPARANSPITEDEKAAIAQQGTVDELIASLSEAKAKEQEDNQPAEQEPLPQDPLGDMSPADRATFHSAFDKPGVPGVAPQK